MNLLSRTPYALLMCILGAASISACDWVDSTGSQTAEPAVTEVFLDDTPIGGAIVLRENVQANITTSRDTTASVDQTYSWSEEPVAEGKLEVCSNQNGFNIDLAADTLVQACTVASDCNFKIEQVETDDGAAEFRLLSPILKASVGVRHELTVVDSDGRSNTRDVDFCLVAFNEPPIANNDAFVVIEGTRLVVDGGDDGLLSNDSDDIDDSNTEYRILPQPSIEPEFAAFFELGSDGGFVYESSLTDIRADQLDSFEYELSDGVYTSKAQVTLRIVTSNQAPDLIDDIPLLTATEGEVFSQDLSLYFEDPEGVDLTFTFVEDDDFPSGGSLELDEDGVFSGIPADDDVGSYVLTLVASDGGRETEAIVMLEVDAAPVVPQNSAPEYEEDTVFDQIILLGRFIRPVQPVFEDPDGDDLTYEIIGTSDLPAGVELDVDTGIVSGRPSLRTWVRNLRIEATDPFGASAISEPFYIRVR